jgi:hypothetical protein
VESQFQDVDLLFDLHFLNKFLHDFENVNLVHIVPT